jgi:hypothetical protein
MKFFLAALVLGTFAGAVFAQDTTAHLIVTAEGRHGAPPPVVNRDDVTVEVNKHPARIENWVPLRGDQANLQLYIAIDDGEDRDVALQYGDLKKFINAQPPTTQIGIAYLQNGAAIIAQPPTSDHARAAAALRIPFGNPGISASPYIAISDLIKKWPAGETRREVLLLSSGIDPLYMAPDLDDPYLGTCISDAQRAGIPLDSIYYSSAGHLGHSFWRVNWGQNYLSEMADATGGEMYWQGMINAVSFAPFLQQLGERLNNQYLLTVSVPAAAKKPELESVRVRTQKPDVSLVSASDILVGH